MRRFKKLLLRVLLFLAAAYLLLLIPGGGEKKPALASTKPFAWNSDSLWENLEARFIRARKEPPALTDSAMLRLRQAMENNYQSLSRDSIVASTDERLSLLLSQFFSIAPLAAARQTQNQALIAFYSKCKQLIKTHSQRWDMNQTAVRSRVYQLLYGMRAATEEVLLQSKQLNFSEQLTITPEPSATPSITMRGIKVHSGDLLVSRGGAEVSALISRGNDYPGNFSHVALLYIDAATKAASFIEAHIEKGVALADTGQYMKDRKLRFTVLRPRAALPALISNPLLPHQAALLALNEAKQRHIPYDFKMDFADSSRMFCSEVGSYAYRKNGLQLWQAPSTISSQGVVNWLHAFGVENFVTQMPSDLEYDPQLSVVTEWCDPQTLLKDHIDNAVMDALLESADAGETIGYSRWMLPLARVIKAWGWLQNKMGKESKIPEGMSAVQALKNNTFVEKHVQLKAATEQLAATFEKENGYRPPYWQLIKLARTAKKGL
jgi:Permuted papain-like amidase enzyme, YaeF/YiiX, C92 family